MKEATKRILAYQQTPLVLTCVQSGHVPEDFLVTLTSEEREYVRARTRSPVEPLFYELLPLLGAAGILSTVSALLVDVHAARARTFTDVDGITFPLAEEQGTRAYLIREYYETYREDLKRLVAKTEQRFGTAHVVHLALLPYFVRGAVVPHDIVTFGEPCMDAAVHAPAEYAPLYESSAIARFERHTWVGLHRKLFSTPTLRRELLERLGRIHTRVLA